MPIANIVAFDGGLVNRPAPHLLADNQAVVVENCEIDTGAIVPLKDSLLAATVGTTNQSIYKFNGAWDTATGERWYAEIAQTLYFVDAGSAPKKTRTDTASAVNLGIPAPDAGYAALHAGTPLNLLAVEGVSYAVTNYSSLWDAESAPLVLETVHGLQLLSNDITGGSASVVVTITQGGVTAAMLPTSGRIKVDSEVIAFSGSSLSGSTWTLTGLSRGQLGTTAVDHYAGATLYLYGDSIDLKGLAVSTDAQVTHMRVYQAIGGEYLLVEEFTKPVGPTVDRLESVYTALPGAAALASDNHDVPPALDGLAGPYNGMLMGWKANVLYWSKVGQYDAWPQGGSQQFEFRYDIASAVVFGGSVVVLCADGVYVVTGDDPEQLLRTKALTHYGCQHGRTAVDAGLGLLYLSPDGVCLFDGAASQLVSYQSLTRETFSLTNPKAAFWNGQYYLFHGAGCVIGDFRGGGPIWRTATVTAASVFVSDADDALFLGKTGAIHQWGAGIDLSWRYWTGELAVGSLSATKIFHTLVCHYEDEVRCELYVDGNRYHDKTIQGSRKAYRMRLSGAARGYRPQLRLSGTGTVYALEFEFSGPGRAR